jgi:glycosyltransferase involved in cell wall biosynthesis
MVKYVQKILFLYQFYWKLLNIVKNEKNKIDIILPCYNEVDLIDKSVSYLIAQQIEFGYTYRIIIVDDNSTDDTKSHILALADKHPVILPVLLSKNQGRSGARNAGIELTKAEYIILLDADCFLKDTLSLNKFIKYFNKGYYLIIGSVNAEGNKFWDRYQQDISERRLASKNLQDQTVAIAGFKRELITKLNSDEVFNSDYKDYGFEDRDFLLRSMEYVPEEKIAFAREIKAIHADQLELKTICMKMQNAARYSAPYYFAEHKDSYIQSNFAIVDIQFMPAWIRLLFIFIYPFRSVIYDLSNYFINVEIFPYSLKKIFAKSCFAIFYFSGSKQRAELE